MSVAVTYVSQINAVETSGGAFVGTDNTVTVNGMNRTESLTASTSVPVTTQTAFQKALSAGAGTIDLTDLPDHNGVASEIDGTGLKLQVAKFANPSSNANSITVTFGASDPYLLAGSAWKVILQPGQEVTFFLNEAAPNIASNAKDIDIAGTGSQVLNVQLIMG